MEGQSGTSAQFLSIQRQLDQLLAAAIRMETKLDKHLDDDEVAHLNQEHRLSMLEADAKRDRGIGLIVTIILSVLAGLGLIPKPPAGGG